MAILRTEASFFCALSTNKENARENKPSALGVRVKGVLTAVGKMAQMVGSSKWDEPKAEDPVKKGVDWEAVFTEDMSHEDVFTSMDRYWTEKDELNSKEINGFKAVIDKRIASARENKELMDSLWIRRLVLLRRDLDKA